MRTHVSIAEVINFHIDNDRVLQRRIRGRLTHSSGRVSKLSSSCFLFLFLLLLFLSFLGFYIIILFYYCEVYHEQFYPPKEVNKDDITGEQLTKRHDDSDEIVLRRIRRSRTNLDEVAEVIYSHI